MENNKILTNINNFKFYSDIFLPSNVNGEGLNYIKSLKFKKNVITKIYSEYPNAYYIINFRDLNDWLNSRKRHVEKNNKLNLSKNHNVIWDNIDLNKWEKEYLEYYDFLMSFFHNKKYLKINICDGNNEKNGESISTFLKIKNIKIIKIS